MDLRFVLRLPTQPTPPIFAFTLCLMFTGCGINSEPSPSSSMPHVKTLSFETNVKSAAVGDGFIFVLTDSGPEHNVRLWAISEELEGPVDESSAVDFPNMQMPRFLVSPYHMAIENNRVHLVLDSRPSSRGAPREAHLITLDVSQPENMRIAGQVPLNGEVVRVSVGEEWLSTITGDGEITLFNISGPGSPTPVGTVDGGQPPPAVAISGNSLILVNRGELRVIDLSDFPERVDEMGSLLNERYSELPANKSDLSGPPSPSQVKPSGERPAAGWHDVEVADDVAYIAAGDAGLIVVDLAERRAPKIIAQQSLPDSAVQLELAGNRAIVMLEPTQNRRERPARARVIEFSESAEGTVSEHIDRIFTESLVRSISATRTRLLLLMDREVQVFSLVHSLAQLQHS